MNLAKTGIMFFCIVMLGCMNVFAQQSNVVAGPINLQAMRGEFQKIDTNKDGFITPEEMQAYRAKRFNELDKDKSGVLDAKELKADKTGMFKNADKNKDGKVGRKEATSQFKEYFKQMDSNKDGKVSEKEFKEYNPIVVKF